MTPSLAMRDDNSITNSITNSVGLPSSNCRLQSQLRLEAPLSFNNSRSGYRSPPIVPAVKARAKRLAKEIGIPASQNKIQKPQVTNTHEPTCLVDENRLMWGISPTCITDPSNCRCSEGCVEILLPRNKLVLL
ncbi:hypothetical protein BHYA_0148g00170 [Botrytis hyacinthi]|uniref:Uncharacterized protein n=1 Tax=Botrytis hyacinthi TaxID=278943 RepID=A0A4Z1GKE2_9HELO|nr:hypothetical protein BHYA_0148g00170 [Botrytis hyacinthi]